MHNRLFNLTIFYVPISLFLGCRLCLLIFLKKILNPFARPLNLICMLLLKCSSCSWFFHFVVCSPIILTHLEQCSSLTIANSYMENLASFPSTKNNSSFLFEFIMRLSMWKWTYWPVKVFHFLFFPPSIQCISILMKWMKQVFWKSSNSQSSSFSLISFNTPNWCLIMILAGNLLT